VLLPNPNSAFDLEQKINSSGITFSAGLEKFAQLDGKEIPFIKHGRQSRNFEKNGKHMRAGRTQRACISYRARETCHG
jgi:hypothetical protein